MADAGRDLPGPADGWSLHSRLHHHAAQFSTWDQVVILYALSTFIVVALLVFGLMLARTLIRLWAEHQAQQLGSRFKTKMVFGAMAVSLLPLVFMFFISYALMNRTLEPMVPRAARRRQFRNAGASPGDESAGIRPPGDSG